MKPDERAKKKMERARLKMERAQIEWKKSVEYHTSRDYKNISDFNKAEKIIARKYDKYQKAIEELLLFY